MHKDTKNGLTPFRLILSAVGMSSYKLAQFLLAFLTPLTQNEYTFTDSFHFIKEICKQDPNLYMASLDVDSLFTNISMNEIIDVGTDSLYKDDENTPKIPEDIFRNLPNMATMVVYLFQTSIFFVKKENLSLMFIGKIPSVVSILISTASYLKPIKPI